MAEEIRVNAEHLNAGARHCDDAADSAHKAAEELALAPVPAGIFGDFAEAHQFHATVSAAHQSHIEQLRAHHKRLTELSEKSAAAARMFTATDASGAEAIGSAGDELG
jgi:hypothetical protein